MSERTAIQNPMLDYAQAIGWEYVSPAEAHALRGNEAGLFFTDVLRAQLLRLNPGVVDDTKVGDIIRQLTLLRPNKEGNRDALGWMRGEGSVFVPGESRERNVHIIDFEHTDLNMFQVTDEWRQQGVAKKNRSDVMFLINGLPVALCETKAAHKADGLAEGMRQVRRYHEETPEMLLAAQVFDVTHLIDFYYGVTWETSRKSLFNWKDEEPGDYEHKVKAFFDRERILRVLRDYIIFLTRDDRLEKIILRQHQTLAVDKGVERAQDPVKRRGLVWHTQGSGKTLTMISIASRLLREAQGGEKPTVLMLVDRNELESQLFKNLVGYGIAPEMAASKRHLRRLLASDYRGLIVSMIHKFEEADANLNTRESITVLVDEAHRSTGGNLGNYLLGALPNATFIGFTGTPIDRLAKGQGTFKVFGVDDPRGYLDKYSIRESIEDGTTVPLNYTLAPSDLLVDRETLEREFLNLTEAEGVSDIEELNAILDRAVALKEIMKNPDRVRQVATLVTSHFRENVEPMGFKAFLVGVDREACALYKKALDVMLPAEYSEVVYSSSPNDSKLLKEFAHTPVQERDIRKAFINKSEQPKILIVTEKLLTGFDAPILYCIYLDKPMRDHVLLQTIARVNRPYEDDDGQVKPYGFIFDFVGIFDNIEKALAFDSDMVASVIQNIDVLRNLFATMMREQGKEYLALTPLTTDKECDRAIAYFQAKEEREEFYKLFRQLQNLYDILSPDSFLRPYIEQYEALAELYAVIRNAYSVRPYVDRELTEKTKVLLRQYSVSGDIDMPGEIRTLGAREVTALKRQSVSDVSKVLNLRKLLAEVVISEGGSKPFLLSIGDRAEQLIQQWEDRQLSTQQALDGLDTLSQEYFEAEKEREQYKVDENVFAIYRAVKPLCDTVTIEQAQALNALFEQFPDYQWNDDHGRRLRVGLYNTLKSIVGAGKMIETANLLMRMVRV